MKIQGQARRVTIYIDENDKWENKPLYMAILEMLKAEGCAGATVTRAMAGFGARSRIHSINLNNGDAEDLPLVIEWIDSSVRVKRVIPTLQEMVTEGLITIDKVKVAVYSHRQLRKMSTTTRVKDIMSHKTHAVRANAPLLEIIELLLDNVYRALPVVDDDKHVVGIVTEGNLLDKVQFLVDNTGRKLTRLELATELQRLRRIDQTVAKAMTPNPITVSEDATIIEAVNLMTKNEVKRLPVVNSNNRLMGIVSRVNVLRALSEPPITELPRKKRPPGHHVQVGGIMTSNIPTVQADTLLPEIVGLLVSSARRRVVVIDETRHVIGIITDGDLIKQTASTISTPTDPLPEEQADDVYVDQRTAADIMTTNVISVTPETPLTEALHLLLTHGIKRMPVVNEQNQFVGLVGRGGILQVLGQQVTGINVL